MVVFLLLLFYRKILIELVGSSWRFLGFDTGLFWLHVWASTEERAV